ncbi:MAG TPA: antibiotic biosynthesis monooxygenase [Polyangiaceae bacterium]|jgi:quinol monooxygenase YgiN
MVKVALVVRLVAKPGKEEEVNAFLAGAEPLAKAEAFTPAWFALRTAKDVFYIVDAFANDADRGKHLTGDIAKALMAKAGDLLAQPPVIEKADVLGAKLPA